MPSSTPSAYINDLDHGDEHRTEAVYGANVQRLAETKPRSDPDNVFRANVNIVPDARSDRSCSCPYPLLQ